MYPNASKPLAKFYNCKFRTIPNFRRIFPIATFALQRRSYFEWSNKASEIDSYSNNENLKTWILEQIAHLQPSRVHLCDGSLQENKELLQLLSAQGTLIPLDQRKHPNSFLARSDPIDVARTESSTFICSESKSEAGPTNNWRDPQEASKEFETLSENCMRGRKMYVVPFCMGPLESPYSMIGIQITDSPLVVVQMRIMTRMGISVIKKLAEDGEFVPCIHTMGTPLVRSQMDTTWPCNEKKLILHFPEQQRVLSFGSGYGGNALLGKKCLALRLASVAARHGGWLAEHMLIIGLTNPEGRKKYIAAAFPSACGKTNVAMMRSALPGWEVRCLGDDIAWLHLDKDGALRAINPEFGFFGVAPGTCEKTNPNMIDCLRKDTIYTNTGITPDFDVWWEGKTPKRPPSVITWLRKELKQDDPIAEVAQANSRFCVPIRNCRVLDPEWDSPQGVPLDAIVFGGRRSEVVPLALQSRGWKHGVFLGSVMGSETTAAAVGRRGLLRIDPFAMKPFCGYNMADYFAHWLSFEKRSKDASKLPKFFAVNWFRKKANRFLWPGFGENIRVLKWIFERCDDKPNHVESAIGKLPKPDALDTKGLNTSKEDINELLQVEKKEWGPEIIRIKEFYASFGKKKIPLDLVKELEFLETQVEGNRPSEKGVFS